MLVKLRQYPINEATVNENDPRSEGRRTNWPNGTPNSEPTLFSDDAICNATAIMKHDMLFACISSCRSIDSAVWKFRVLM